MNSKKPEFLIGEIFYILGHKLQIKHIYNHSFGYFYKLSCYPHCCTIPNILKIQISEKDLIKIKELGLKI